MNYYIWSFEHNAWWKPARRGYTIHMDEAGVYSQAEALKLCRGANFALKHGKFPKEAMVPIIINEE